MDVAFLDKHGRVKFRPSTKQEWSPDAVSDAVDALGGGNTSVRQVNVNTSPSKHLKLAFKVSPEVTTLHRRRSAIPIAQLQPTEIRRATVEATSPTRFPDLHSPGTSSLFATSPRSLIPLPRSPTKASKATSLAFRSPRSPRGKLDQISGVSKSTDTANQPLPPSPSSPKGRAPILLTQIRADERHRKGLEAEMAKKGKKKTTLKADTLPEPLAENPVEEKAEPVTESCTPEVLPALVESAETAQKLNAEAKEFIPGPKKVPDCPKGSLCSHQAPQCEYGHAGRHPEADRSLHLGPSHPIRLPGDPKEYQVHVTPTGSFCTTTTGVLSKMPESCMLQGLDQFSMRLPLAIKHNSRLIGRPYLSPFGNDVLPPPYNTQDMPPPASMINEQFLIAATKLNSVYNRREAARNNPNYEPPIHFGFSQRAHFAQGASVGNLVTRSHIAIPHSDSTLSGLPAASNPRAAKLFEHTNIHKNNGAQSRGAVIMPGLRGGGPSNLRGDLSTKSGVSNLRGIYPEAVVGTAQMPTVVDYQGRLEVCFPPGHSTLRRICNEKGKYVALYGGFDVHMSSKEESWVTKEVYWCLYCGSDEHGLIHCPIWDIHLRVQFCLHCRESGHILAACPRPPQFFPGRPIAQSLELYVFTLHWKQQLFASEVESRVRQQDDSTQVGSGGAGRHPFGLSGPCPDCGPVHHTKHAIEWVDNIMRDGKPGIVIDRKCTWYVDTRYCPLYWTMSHPIFYPGGYTVYNPLGSKAVDTLYRVYIRCQGWVTHTPRPIVDKHIFRRALVNRKWVVLEPDFTAGES